MKIAAIYGMWIFEVSFFASFVLWQPARPQPAVTIAAGMGLLMSAYCLLKFRRTRKGLKNRWPLKFPRKQGQ